MSVCIYIICLGLKGSRQTHFNGKDEDVKNVFEIGTIKRAWP